MELLFTAIACTALNLTLYWSLSQKLYLIMDWQIQAGALLVELSEYIREVEEDA